jgi:hypothetical protein
MARPLRIQQGGWSRLTRRGNERRTIFPSSEDYARYSEKRELTHCFPLTPFFLFPSSRTSIDS